MNFESYIQTIPDFPKPGILFRDFTPLLADGAAFSGLIDHLKERHQDRGIDVVAGIEARGFILASALAYALDAGTVLVRKAGKLPHKIHAQEYELEYGSSVLEVQQNAFLEGQRVLIIDDVLATGGTVAATVELIEKNFSVTVEEINFLMELDDLKGREKLQGHPIYSVLHY
jgi:adenine phosphoribosyltransferase